MDDAIGTQVASIQKFKDRVAPSDLTAALYEYSSQIKVLSLDCFDTLLWRKTAIPVDVFYDLQNSKSYKACNITSIQRVSAEVYARYNQFIRKGTYEISLKDIYELGFSSLTSSEIDLLVEEEILAEINMCYAFPPIVEMIHQAKLLGLKVIVVSNTYLKELQLRRLLEKTLPTEAFNAIDQIFCSCEYGDSKSGQLFQVVLKKLDISPATVLHVGDNRHADCEKPRSIGMHSLHLTQFNPSVSEINRLQVISSSISIPEVRHTRALISPFHGVFSLYAPQAEKPETSIGYVTLGPVFYAFAQSIAEAIERLQQQNGRSPKVLFLMRDGYLPSVACRELFGYDIGKQARISRFTAVAASFRTKADVEKFLAEYFTILPAEYMCKQLLLSEELSKQIIQKASESKFSKYELCQLILQESVLKNIFKKSTEFRQRLIKYLRKTIDLEPEDTLLFVDIGYAGSAQKALSPVLQDELNLMPTHGCYLLILNLQNWQKSFHGLISPSWCDDRIMNLVGSDVSLLEQFCCSGDDSVVDYDENGDPVFLKSPIHHEQLEKIKKVQNECVRFISDAKTFFKKANIHFTIEQLRDYALAKLTRLLYLPTENEIEYLQGFSHDKNKGFQEAFQIYGNVSNELSKLRQHGLLYKDEHPHTLRAASLEMSLSMMTKRRYNFIIDLDDRSFRQEWVNIILLINGKSISHLCNAKLTYDGYFALCLPVDQSYSEIAIVFGAHYKFVQIENIALIKSNAFLTNNEHNSLLDLTSRISLNQMLDKGSRIFECETKNGAILIPIPPHYERSIFRVVFRPLGTNE